MKRILLPFFIFIFSAVTHADIQLRCDEQGNVLSINDLDFTKRLTTQDNMSFEYDCQKLGSCLLNYDKIQNLNDDSTKILENLWITVSSDKSEISDRLMAMKEARFRCEKQLSKTDVKKEILSLVYPFKGPNSNKSSGQYDFQKIEQLLEVALLDGVDPMLVLGILVNENPPIVSAQKDKSILTYEDGYGLIPVDGIAIIDFLGCKISPKKELAKKQAEMKFPGDSEFKKLLTTQKKTQDWFINNKIPLKVLEDITAIIYAPKDDEESDENEAELLKDVCDNGENIKICTTYLTALKKVILDRITNSQIDKYTAEYPKEAQNLMCHLRDECVGVIKKSERKKQISFYDTKDIKFSNNEYCNIGDHYYSGQNNSLAESSDTSLTGSCCVDIATSKSNSLEFVSAQLKNIVAVDFIKSKIKAANLSDVSLAIQKYNGLGCLGCTEKVTTTGSCFDRLEMKKTPLYGARVADVMISMLMKNPKIIETMKTLSKKLKKPIKSIFCNKPGEVKIAEDYFFKQQKDFLLSNGENRAKACATFFK